MMADNIDLTLVILTAREAERPPFVAAAHQLSNCLSAASGADFRIQLSFSNALSPETLGKDSRIVIISLLSEIDSLQENFTDIAARRRQQISSLMNAASCPIFLCTIFRHVPRGQSRQNEPSRFQKLERIRRLNLLMVELSQAAGIGVIDIDRVLAHFGARLLQTDYLLTGKIGAEAAAHAIVSTLLDSGLDEFVRLEWLEKAQNLHGDLHRLSQKLDRSANAVQSS